MLFLRKPMLFLKYAKGTFYSLSLEEPICVPIKFAIVTNIVSNICRTINKFFPSTIIYFTSK